MNFEKKNWRSLFVNIHSHFFNIESLLNPQQPSDPTNTSKLYRVVLDLSKENNIFAPAVAIGTNLVILLFSHSVILSTYLSLNISPCFSMCPPICSSLFLFVCLSVCFFASVNVCQSIYFTEFPPSCHIVSWSLYLSISSCTFDYLYVYNNNFIIIPWHSIYYRYGSLVQSVAWNGLYVCSTALYVAFLPSY